MQLALLGSSGTGKSVLIRELIENLEVCTNSTATPTFIYCYKTELPQGVNTRPNIYTFKGIPNLKNVRLQFANGKSPLVIIFDDLLSGIFFNIRIYKLFSTTLYIRSNSPLIFFRSLHSP